MEVPVRISVRRLVVGARRRVVGGARRMRTAASPILQSAGAAGAAWFLAQLIPGHDQPVFAPIAAVIALGISAGTRGRQAVEMILGVVVGIAVADALVAVLGRGAWQLAVVCALAMLAAVFLRQSPLFVSQAGVWSILVVAVEREGTIAGLDRLLDGLVGGGVALVVSQLLFPLDPIAAVAAAARPVLADLRTVLEDTASALADSDRELAESAHERARDLQGEVRGLREALGVSVSAARLSPRYRGTRGRLDPYSGATEQLDVAARNGLVLVGAAVRLLREGRDPPGELSEAVRELAEAVEALSGQLERPAEVGSAVADRAAAAIEHARRVRDGGTTVAVMANQVEAMAHDLLRGSGRSEGDLDPAVGERVRG